MLVYIDGVLLYYHWQTVKCAVGLFDLGWELNTIPVPDISRNVELVHWDCLVCIVHQYQGSRRFTVFSSLYLQKVIEWFVIRAVDFASMDSSEGTFRSGWLLCLNVDKSELNQWIVMSSLSLSIFANNSEIVSFWGYPTNKSLLNVVYPWFIAFCLQPSVFKTLFIIWGFPWTILDKWNGIYIKTMFHRKMKIKSVWQWVV